MNCELEILESVVSPLQLVWALGIPVTVEGDHHVCTLDPLHKFRVTPQGFLSTDPGDMFKSGTATDFAAYRVMLTEGLRGRQAFLRGVQDMMRAIRDPAGALRPEQAEAIAHAAWLRRRVYDFVVARTHDSGLAVGAKNASAITMLRGKNIDRELVPGTIGLFEGRDWAEFRVLCEAADVSLPSFNFSTCRVVIPYYSGPGVIAFLQMLGRADPDGNRVIPVFKAKFAFSGLTVHVPGETVLLHSSGLEAAAITTGIKQEGGRGSCMAVCTDMSAGVVGWCPEEVTFMETEESSSGAPSVLDMEGVKVWTTSAGDVRLAHAYRAPWREQLVERILKRLATTNEFDADTRLMLLPCRHSIPLRQQLLGELIHADLREDLREKVENTLQDGLLLSNRSIKIYSTIAGYRYCLPAKGEDGPLHELSNFTLELQRTVVFPEETNFYHHAAIRTREGEFGVILQSDDLESARKLDKAVKQGCLISGFGEDHDTPVVSDLLNARHLIPFWRSQTSKLPREQGLAFLGWDGIKNSYHGPGFHVSERVNFAARPKHPGVEVLRFFDGNTAVEPVLDSSLPADLADIVSQAVAMCARSFAGQPVRPITILNAGDAPRILRTIFQALGQTAAIELNANQRTRELPGLRGFPAWGTGYTAAQVAGSTMPLFMLGDRGMRMADGHTDEELQAAGETLAWLLPETARHMLRSGTGFRRQHGVLYESELAREGAALICRLASVPTWPISQTQYELLEKVLRDIPPTEVGQWFEHDLRNQQVLFAHRKLPKKVDRRDLLLQFSTLVKSIEDRDGCFVMDAVSAVALLDNFYQGDGVPSPINVPALQVAAK